MANRRMFSLDVIDTDRFLDMPASTQCLYFHLGMRSDDDGFVSNPKKITKLVNCAGDDLNVLVSRGFIIPFESGVVVLTHWRQNNYIQSDRRKDTIYQKELASLTVVNGVYEISAEVPCIQNVSNLDTSCIHGVSKLDTQVSIGKNSIDKDSNKYRRDFEEFWAAYPRKAEKAKGHKCYQARLKDGFSEGELLRAAKAYGEECRKDKREQKYIKLASTFLSASTPFMDYLNDEKGGAEDVAAVNGSFKL